MKSPVTRAGLRKTVFGNGLVALAAKEGRDFQLVLGLRRFAAAEGRGLLAVAQAGLLLLGLAALRRRRMGAAQAQARYSLEHRRLAFGALFEVQAGLAGLRLGL